MRLVLGVVLMAAALIISASPAIAYDSAEQAITLASADTSLAHKATNTLNTGVVQPRAEFHEGEFIYIPPAPQEPGNPLFHSQTFQYVPSTSGESAGELVRPISGVIPLPSKGSRQRRVEVATRDLAIPTAIPTPKPEAESAVRKETAPAESHLQPVKLEMNAVDELKILPASVDIEDPRFYHGSFVFDAATGRLVPEPRRSIWMPAAATTSLTPNGGAPATAASVSASVYSSGIAAHTVFPRSGRAMYYNPGIMDVVLSFRLEMGQVVLCPECVGYVALLGREDLNRRVWLQWEDGDVEGPFLVIDTAAKHHIPSLLSRNWVVDVDYETAMRRGMNRPLPVTVLSSAPRSQRQISANGSDVFEYSEASFVH